MEPKPEAKCASCGHSYFYHAPDLQTDKNKCWHGAATGDGCEHECKQFVEEAN
jgi:hypothetical protein